MAKGKIVIFIGLFFLVVATPDDTEYNVQDDPNYTVVFLAYQVTNRGGNTYWTVEGLWAEREAEDGDDFKYSGYNDCDTNNYTFDYESLDERLKKGLDLAWPRRGDSSFNTDEAFWEQEVMVHGSCLQDILPDGAQYLQKAVDLFLRTQLDQLLSPLGKHRAGAMFSTEDLIKYIPNIRPLLECDGILLTRITYCYKKTWVPKDCLPTSPNPAKDCPDQILYFY